MKEKPLSKRALRTRTALLNAGLKLLEAHPIETISIDDIVKTARVGKGSFFNHFGDKQKFASEVATVIRLDLTKLFRHAVKDISEPLIVLAVAMKQVTDFALKKPRETIILLRTPFDLSLTSNAPNQMIVSLIEACVSDGSIRPEAKNMGILYWHSLCAMLMANIIEDNLSQQAAYIHLNEMLTLGLTGLGVDLKHTKKVIKQVEKMDFLCPL